MTYEFARQINIYLPAFVGFFLGLRICQTWNPWWVRRIRHRNHYRYLMVSLLMFVLMTTFGALYYAGIDAEPGFVSVVYTFVLIFVLAGCFFWPSRKKVIHPHEA